MQAYKHILPTKVPGRGQMKREENNRRKQDWREADLLWVCVGLIEFVGEREQRWTQRSDDKTKAAEMGKRAEMNGREKEKAPEIVKGSGSFVKLAL